MIKIKVKQTGDITDNKGIVGVTIKTGLFNGYSLGELLTLIVAAQDKAMEDFGITKKELNAFLKDIKDLEIED